MAQYISPHIDLPAHDVRSRRYPKRLHLSSQERYTITDSSTIQTSCTCTRSSQPKVTSGSLLSCVRVENYSTTSWNAVDCSKAKHGGYSGNWWWRLERCTEGEPYIETSSWRTCFWMASVRSNSAISGLQESGREDRDCSTRFVVRRDMPVRRCCKGRSMQAKVSKRECCQSTLLIANPCRGRHLVIGHHSLYFALRRFTF